MPEAADRPTTRSRRWLRGVAGAFGLLLVALSICLWISTDQLRAFGGSPDAASRARMQASPHFVNGRFQNAIATELMAPGASWRATRQWFFGEEMRAPSCPLPLITDTAARLTVAPGSGLRVTWLGHSTTLIELDGVRILTDPMWSERASPSRWVGPRRFHRPPLALSALPPLDAVIISHEHYDHLDMETVRALASHGVPFHVPLGIGAHLARWGVPATQIVEHDWWEESTIAHGVRLVSTPARHFNGRGVPGRTGALWTSWSLLGPTHRAFFSGDTGLTEGFREIANRLGPFDVALLEIGQYHQSWGEIHLGPIGALDAFAMLGARTLLPIHWATFELGIHAWSEPAETLVREAERRGVQIVTPQLGEPVEPTLRREVSPWWRALPPIAARCP